MRPDAKHRPRGLRRQLAAAASAIAVLLAAYLALAYGALPLFWTADEAFRRPPEAMLTRTADGRPGDPVNLGFEADEATLAASFAAAGWRPADPVTLRSGLRIGESVLLDRPYPDAPVSSLYLDGRRQDLAFEKEVGSSADRRHHVRLWRIGPDGAGSRFWLAAASRDSGVELSRETGQVTHRIDPDLDAERASLVADLERAGRVRAMETMPGIGPVRDGRNGGGDPYFTDGTVVIVALGGD